MSGIVYGFTPTGFLAKPLSQIATEIDAGLQTILGKSAGTNPDGTIPIDTAAGQMKIWLVDREAGFWDLLQAAVAQFDPNAATGAGQDAVCSITGTVREPAQFSSVVSTCTGTPNTILAIGRVSTVSTTATRWDSAIALNLLDPNYPSSTIAAVAAWAQSNVYAAGARVTANGNVYQCTIGGTSLGSGTGPAGTTPGVPITDNSVTWVFVGIGTGAVDVKFVAEIAGAFGAVPNALNQIATPVQGWSSINNLVGATVGQAQEIDSALRVRRDAELAATGNAVVNAIRSRLLLLNQNSTDPLHLPILACTPFHNDTDLTDANNVPPHAVEVLVLYAGADNPTTNQDIANAVFASVGAGIATTGNQTATVVDSQGNNQTVKWSKPTQVPVYATLVVGYDPTKWPTIGTAALVTAASVSAVMTFGLQSLIGQSVRSQPIGASVTDGPSQTSVAGAAVYPAPAGSKPAPGIVEVSSVFIGTAPSPGSSATIALTSRQIAVFDPSRIVITPTPETP